MKNKKKKIMLIVAVILMILVLAILITGRTYSKYRAEVKGSKDLPIAKWSFLVNGQTGTMTLIELKETFNTDALVNEKIAPGAKGNFDIVVDATGSEVGIDYYVKFLNVTDEPSNLVYTYEGMEVETLKELEELLKGRINLSDEKMKKNISVNWEWKYETGSTSEEILAMDQIDTNEGTNLTNFSFDVYVIGTQVNPQLNVNL